MDPVAALGLAAGVVQFIQFATAIVSKTSEISKSASGILAENVNLASTTEDLKRRANMLKQSQDPANTDLVKLSAECHDVAQELLNVLEKVRVKGPLTKFKCLRKALRSEWSKDKITSIKERLTAFRQQMNLVICVQLRTQIDVAAADQLDGFQRLDKASRFRVEQLLIALKSNEDMFSVQLNTRISSTEILIEHQHEMTRTEIISLLDSTHTNLTQGLMECQRSIEHLEVEIKRHHEDLRQIVQATQIQSGIERETSRNRGNKLIVLIMSLENLVLELKLILNELWQVIISICEKLKLNLEFVASQLALVARPSKQFLLPTTSHWSQAVDEAAADTIKIYYRRRYMRWVKVHRVSCNLMVNSHNQVISQCPRTIKQLRGPTCAMAREGEASRFIKFMSAVVLLCDQIFPGMPFAIYSFTELALLTTLRLLRGSQLQLLRLKIDAFPSSSDQLDIKVHPAPQFLLTEDALSRLQFGKAHPIPVPLARPPSTISTNSWSLGPVELGPLANLAERFLQDIALWRSMGEAMGLKSHADEAWATSFPHGRWRDADARYVEGTLSGMISLLVALLSHDGGKFHFQNIPKVMKETESVPSCTNINKILDPDIWAFASALEMLGGPLHCLDD